MQTTMSLEHKCGRLFNIFMGVSQSRTLHGIVKVDFIYVGHILFILR